MTVTSLDYAYASQLYLYNRESGRVITADSTSIGSGDVLVPDELPPLVVMEDNHRPVSGTITVDDTKIELNPAESFAVLDRGRGKWPYKMSWNWAAGSGIVDGKRLGLQLVGRWTKGTGVTENGLFADGRLSYGDDEPDWTYNIAKKSSPWHVRGENVDATLTPFHRRHASSNVGIIASSTYQAFGVWSGLTGWAEQATNRW